MYIPTSSEIFFFYLVTACVLGGGDYVFSKDECRYLEINSESGVSATVLYINWPKDDLPMLNVFGKFLEV
jgi:hypothetical protein